MPSESEHLSKARSNRRFGYGLRAFGPCFRDWIVTSLFYAAVHFIEAFLAMRAVHSRSHADRDRYVLSFFRPQYPDYRHLKDDSKKARYESFKFNRTDIRKSVKRLNEVAKGAGYR
jgi:hypothetical protein